MTLDLVGMDFCDVHIRKCETVGEGGECEKVNFF